MATKEASKAEIGTANTNTQQYTVITDGDAVEVARAIAAAKVALDNAQETYEQRLLATPVIWGSKASDSVISKESGVSKASVGIYRRIGRILALKPSDGIKPSVVAATVNKGFNAPGSLKANVDSVIDALCVEKDGPTWADAIKAINKATGTTGTKKSDAEKADGYIKSLSSLVAKGYKLTDDQKAAIAAL
jgi:hypothetical protein